MALVPRRDGAAAAAARGGAAAATPNSFRIGPERNEYVYRKMAGQPETFDAWRCLKPADGWPNTRGKCLYLLRANPDDEPTTWVASHAPSRWTKEQLLDGLENQDPEVVPIFGSTDPILEAGRHQWDYFVENDRGGHDWSGRRLMTFDTTILG